MEENEDAMNILRYLRPECMVLELHTQPSEPDPDETPERAERRNIADKERVVQELAEIFDRSGAISNPTKFHKDLLHRERKATTAIAPSIAIPHVRSKQVKSFIMGFARAGGEGVPFASLDGSPTRLFFLLASPSFDNEGVFDRMYLKVYRQFAEMLQHEWVTDSLLEAEDEQAVYDILRGYISQ
ncbi:MAG: PTS sugar transporter subunit IIA [Planctomycetota bacterium]|nr:MAG: PTS sugar transporter subunit IIA [Planctomycetota bacterium]